MSDEFEEHRRYLTGIAYRMLGSLAEAEDVVQEAYLRWSSADAVESPRAYLAKIVTRLCLDYLKSARARREAYVGVWLPEPLVDQQVDSGQANELAQDISLGLFTILERLTANERAAFLLHDVFGMEFSDVAEALGQKEATCRKLAERARREVHARKPRACPSQEEYRTLVHAFFDAIRSGDVDALAKILSDQARLVADGGGLVRAPHRAVVGRERIARFFLAIEQRGDLAGLSMDPAMVNGLPGSLVRSADGVVVAVTAFELDATGHIDVIYVVGNPEKLARMASSSSVATQ